MCARPKDMLHRLFQGKCMHKGEMAMKKILFISEHGDPLAPLGSRQAGGQNNYVKQLALALDSLGYAVDIATHWCNASASKIEKIGQHSYVHRFDAGVHGYVDKNDMRSLMGAFYKEIVEALPIKSYTIIHTHYWMSGLVGCELKRNYGIPFIHTNHSLALAKKEGSGELDRFRLACERQVLIEADTVLATTKQEKELIERCAPISRVEVIPIGVAPIYLTQSVDASPTNANYYFYAGRLVKTKGIFELISAFKEVVMKPDVPKDVLLIVAGGTKASINPKTQLPRNRKILTALNGIEDRVLFIGPQDAKQLKMLYGNAIATIMPSYYESFGMVAAEAQAAGCPVIASNVGGLKEVVVDNCTGIHVPKAAPKALAAAMRTLFVRKTARLMMKKKAKQRAMTTFNWKEIVLDVTALYKRSLTYVSKS